MTEISLGIFSPGSPPRKEKLEAGLTWLQKEGFRIQRAPTSSPREGLHAAPPEVRARDFNDLMADEAVDAILCTRGGSGTLGILRHIDYDLAARARKPVVGMSDATSLHLALLKRSRVRGISGPMPVQLSAKARAYTRQRWLYLVRESFSAGIVPLPKETALMPVHPPSAPSKAEGILLPCNLSLLTRLIGTPYLPTLDGAILVLEDLDETPQSIDRMVSHLRLSGVADRLAGVILGQFTRCVPRGPGVKEEEGHAALLEWAGSLGVPALSGFPYGHEALCCTLPVGTRARLTTNPPSLHLLEAPDHSG